jgi:hypothetical protein
MDFTRERRYAHTPRVLHPALPQPRARERPRNLRSATFRGLDRGVIEHVGADQTKFDDRAGRASLNNVKAKRARTAPAGSGSAPLSILQVIVGSPVATTAWSASS